MILTNPDDQLTGSLCQERSKSCAEKNEESRRTQRTQRQMGEMAGPFPRVDSSPIHNTAHPEKNDMSIICLPILYRLMKRYIHPNSDAP